MYNTKARFYEPKNETSHAVIAKELQLEKRSFDHQTASYDSEVIQGLVYVILEGDLLNVCI